MFQVGRINCETESSLCKQLGIVPRRAPRLFVYSYTSSGKAILAEYTEELVAKKVKNFCQEHLPRFSKRVDLNTFDVSAVSSQRTPTVMLLSTKKDTPVIWRLLSGLYNGRFVFYNTEVCYIFVLTSTYINIPTVVVSANLPVLELMGDQRLKTRQQI